MKHSITIFALVACMFASCNKDNEFHQTSIPSPYSLIYADAHVDSIAYITTEHHQLSIEGASWCEVDKTFLQSINSQIDAHPGVYQLMAYFNIQPNLTHNTRSAIFHVSADEYSASGLIVQTANLNIRRPSLAVSSDLSADSVSTMYLSYLANNDSIIFSTEYPWELSVPENSFVTLSSTSGKAGTHAVHFSYTPNTTSDIRRSEIKLTAKCSENDSIMSRIPLYQIKNPETAGN